MAPASWVVLCKSDRTCNEKAQPEKIKNAPDAVDDSPALRQVADLPSNLRLRLAES